MHYRPEKASKSIRNVLFTLLPSVFFSHDMLVRFSCRWMWCQTMEQTTGRKCDRINGDLFASYIYISQPFSLYSREPNNLSLYTLSVCVSFSPLSLVHFYSWVFAYNIASIWLVLPRRGTLFVSVAKTISNCVYFELSWTEPFRFDSKPCSKPLFNPVNYSFCLLFFLRNFSFILIIHIENQLHFENWMKMSFVEKMWKIKRKKERKECIFCSTIICRSFK